MANARKKKPVGVSNARMAKAKAEYKSAKEKYDKIPRKGAPKFGASLIATALRILEVFAVMLMGFVLIVGVGANFLPSVAVSLAGDVNLADMISQLDFKSASSATSSIANMLAIWGFPMMFISVALGCVSFKLLEMGTKKCHLFVNSLIARMNGKFEDDSDSDSDADSSKDEEIDAD